MSEPPPQPETDQPAHPFLLRYAGLPAARWGPGEVGIGILVAFGATFALTLLVALFDRTLETPGAKDAAQLALALALAGTALAFAVADGGGRLKAGLGGLGLGRFGPPAIGLAGIALLAYLASAVALGPLLSPDQKDITRELGTDTGGVGSLIVSGLLIVVAAPLSEELFFRGFMFAGLRRRIPLWPAAIVSAAIWGALHLGGGNAGVAIQLAIFGVILAWLYERSGTLWAPVIAHAVNNSLAFVLLVTDTV